MRTFLKRSLNLVENIIGAPMKKNHWFLLIHLFCFGFAYSAWNDGLTTYVATEYPPNASSVEVTYTQISNLDELNLLKKAAKESFDTKGIPLEANIVLTNDIDLGYFFDGKVCRSKSDSSIASFEPIPEFDGFFNGNDNTITGLCILKQKTTASLETGAVGLFRSHQGNIKNLKIDNAFVQGDVAGIIIGEGSIEKQAEITDCHVTNSTVIGFSAVGGLAGKQVFLIMNSSVQETSLSLESENEIGDIGGLVGLIDVSLDNIVNLNGAFVKNISLNGSLPKQNVGGLIGSIQSDEDLSQTNSIANSFVETDISSKNEVNLGGLIGHYSILSAYISITSSYFKGNIFSSETDDEVSCYGGFIGLAENNTEVQIEKSYQKGSIQTEAGLSVGGFVGQSTGLVYIAESFQKGSIQTKSINQGLFVGSISNSGYNFTSVYAVPDSSSDLEVVGVYALGTIASFSGFIADKNGENSLTGNIKVQPSLLQQPSAAYILNKGGSDGATPYYYSWTQVPDSNDGFPFIKPDYFHPISRVVLFDTSLASDTVYNSPLTGKLDKSVFKKYPQLGGVGQNKYSFEEIIDNEYTGISLTPQTTITEDKIFFLSTTNHYAIKYNLNTDEFVFWLTDSITDYSEKYSYLNLPIIIKNESCFLGWKASKDGIKYTTDPSTEIAFADLFPNMPFSILYLSAVWGDNSTECNGWNAGSNIIYNYISVYAFHGLVTLSNNGKTLTPTSSGYSIPAVVNNDQESVEVPIHIEVTPKKGYELDSLYYFDFENNSTRFFKTGDVLPVKSQIIIYSVFKSTTGEPNPLYKITYDIPFEPVNDSTPTLFFNEDYSLEYNEYQPVETLPALMKAHRCLTNWEVTCSTKGTCSHGGVLTDTPFIDGFIDHGHYFPADNIIPNNFEGDVTLKPVFSDCIEKQTIIQVNLKKNDNGHLSLWNNQREVLSGVGTIKVPQRTDMITPPFYIKAIPDSSFEFNEFYLQYFDNEVFQPPSSKITSNNLLDPIRFEKNVSISALFNKMTLAFVSHFFEQKGGAFLYEGSLDKIEAESPVRVSLLVQNKKGTYKDSLVFHSLETKDSFSMKKICLPIGEFDFTVSLKAANTVISKKYNFTVDSILQFKPSTWHMISLANLDSKFEKSNDDIFFAWNDTAALGDFWQYQELRYMDQKISSQGYWYQSLNEKHLPLQVTTSTCVEPETKVSWELISGQTGWNLIANPYHWPISLNVAESDDSTAFWKWNDSLGAYDRVYHLEPHGAAWVNTTENKKWETTADPFFDSEKTVVAKKHIHQARVLHPNDWKIQLKLKNTLGKEDAHNFIGVSAKPSSIEEPPQGIGSFINLSILNNDDKLAENILSSESSVWSWDILLTSSGNKDASLQLEGINALTAMGYRVAINIDGSLMELKEGTSIPVEIKENGSKATITVMPAQDFNLTQKINQLTYYKQGNTWKIAFDAGLALDRSKAVVSLHNIKGKRITSTVAEVNLGSNELLLNGADFAGVVIMNITIYSERGTILYQHNQKLLDKR